MTGFRFELGFFEEPLEAYQQHLPIGQVFEPIQEVERICAELGDVPDEVREFAQWIVSAQISSDKAVLNAQPESIAGAAVYNAAKHSGRTHHQERSGNGPRYTQSEIATPARKCQLTIAQNHRDQWETIEESDISVPAQFDFS